MRTTATVVITPEMMAMSVWLCVKEIQGELGSRPGGDVSLRLFIAGGAGRGPGGRGARGGWRGSRWAAPSLGGGRKRHLCHTAPARPEGRGPGPR